MGQITNDLPLPTGIRTRMIPGINGFAMHVLEAGDASRPCVLLLHGFPELAYSWRKVMLPLAEAGYYVVAPDQRAMDAPRDGTLTTMAISARSAC